jgi:hypothetical protein
MQLLTRIFVFAVGVSAVSFLEVKGTEDDLQRFSVPTEKQQADTLSLIREVYAEDWAAAKTAIQKQVLARKLYEEGLSTNDDPNSRYMLFRVSRDIAIQNGDAASALAVTDEMMKFYNIDTVDAPLDVIKRLAASRTTSPAAFKVMAESAISLTDRAIESDRYDVVVELSELALSSAKRARDLTLSQLATAKVKLATIVKDQYEEVKESQDLLKADPANPAANLSVGRFRCFVKGDWKSGLLMLALGNDASLRNIAVAELEAEGDEPLEKLKLGDAWWGIAEKMPEEFQQAAKQRALMHYTDVHQALEGITKARIDKRLKENKNLLPAPKLPHVPSDSDAFDVRNGAVVIKHSGTQARNFDIEFMFGKPGQAQSDHSKVRDPETIFSDARLPSHFVEFKTARPVVLRRIALIAAHDEANFARAFSQFRLFAADPTTGRFDRVLFSFRPTLPYSTTKSGEGFTVQPCDEYTLILIAEVPPVESQVFRAEFVDGINAGKTGLRGPRILELDGFE